MVDPGELRQFVNVLKAACEAMQPLISSFYMAINSADSVNSSKLKADKSYFTIADGLGEKY